MTSKPSFSLFSCLYFVYTSIRACCGKLNNQSSGCRPKCRYNQSDFYFHDHRFHDRSSLSRLSTRLLDLCCISLFSTHHQYYSSVVLLTTKNRWWWESHMINQSSSQAVFLQAKKENTNIYGRCTVSFTQTLNTNTVTRNAEIMQ